MTGELIYKNVWEKLTKSAKRNQSKSIVAVAYFAKNGSKLLPLTEGSILLVDASEKAVRSGQTCPAELILLYNNGVRIYSKNNLHAKVFVLGSNLFIGSANVSTFSANYLTEAIYFTTERKSRLSAKDFIMSNCGQELGIARLKKLQKSYRPPKFFVPGKKINNRSNYAEDEPGFYVFQLKWKDFPEEMERESNLGEKEAAKKRIHKSRHSLENFHWSYNSKAKENDIALMVTEEDGNNVVSPPGRIIHVRKWKNAKGKGKIYYLETPNKRRKSMRYLKNKLNRRITNSISENGKKNRNIENAVSEIWNKN